MRVCSCKDRDRKFHVAKRLWIKTFYPPCFLAASNGIGVDLLSPGQISVWESVLDTIIRYSRLSVRDRVRFFDLSELRNMFHSLFILHSADGHVRSCPKYIRNKFKQYELMTTGCPDLLQDCVKLAKELGIMTIDKQTDIVFYDPPEYEDIYRRNDYIEYKNQHNVSL